MKAKVKCLAMFIIAVLVAVFTVGNAFAWFFDKKSSAVKLLGASAGAYFESGNGSEEYPFIIANATHMRNLSVLQNTGRFTDENGKQIKYYFQIKKALTEPLNMGNIWLPPIGNDTYPFIGDFNGNGKSIANLKVTTDKALLDEANYPNQASATYAFSQAVGLFGNTGKDSNISNFILNNPHVVVGAENVNNNKYSSAEGIKKAVGIAVGHVAGKCSSIGVRATDAGASTGDGVGSTSLDVRVTGYSTFNSILGELGAGVESSVTGGGHVAGTGGMGANFGSNLDVKSLSRRLYDIYKVKYGQDYTKKSGTNDLPVISGTWRLPTIDRQSDYPVPNAGTKLAFNVTDDSKYVLDDSGIPPQEFVAANNMGYVIGNQNKFQTKQLTFGDKLIDSGDVTKDWYTIVKGEQKTPAESKTVPRWFYTYETPVRLQGTSYASQSTFRPLTDEEFNNLPAGIRNLISNNNKETYLTLRLQHPVYLGPNAGVQTTVSNVDGSWSYQGQVSWMGKTYGSGFPDDEGYAVDENGNHYSSSGNLLSDGGYDRDENGYYGVDLSTFANFPYIVYSYDSVNGTAYALDEDGNRYYRYTPEDSSEYVYGILSGGYLRTGDSYQYYVAPIAGWIAPIPLIDANGYAMASAGVYYDVSGNKVAGGYVKDSNGYYVPVDSNFVLPITQVTDGYAQDADGNYYGVITLNGQTVYCYLGSDGKTAGYSGFYTTDGNNFLVKATNVDADGFVKYTDTDYYGTYNGISGYVDANGYFYDANGNYYATDENFTEVIKNISSSGYAMTSDGRYYGKGTVNNSTVYGLLDVRNGKSYLKLDGKYIASDGNSYDIIDDEGRVMYDSYQYYGTQYGSPVLLTKDKCIYDTSVDDKGNPKGYSFYDNNWWLSQRGYEICKDVDNQYYGYFVKTDDPNTPFYNYWNDNKPLKAWGNTAEEMNAIMDAGKIGLDEHDWVNLEGYYFINQGGDFITAVEGGEYISVAEGTKNQAISSADINGVEGEFIALKEGEKFKVVKQGEEAIDEVTVAKGEKVGLPYFKGGIYMPNNVLWFKPAVAGKFRFVMYTDTAAETFNLAKVTRTAATKDNPFYSNPSNIGSDIKQEIVLAQMLSPYILTYYEVDCKQEDIDAGNVEYYLSGYNSNGALFMYLDIGSSAAEDTSGIDYEKVSAVDFIYEDVEIKQGNRSEQDPSALIKVGDFIVKTSGTEALYESSKTSVYFDGITVGLKVVYVRLHNEDGKHSGKTICLEYTSTDDLKQVGATNAGLVCPTVSGGSGGGGGTVTPTNPSISGSSTVTVGSTLQLTAKNLTGTVTWSSSNENVATVDSTGKVTAKAAGTATITASNGTSSATKTITVEAATVNVPVTSVTISGAPATMTVGGTATLTATVAPNNATDKTVTWTTSDSSKATVENGVVTAKAAGTVTITATAGGKSDSVTITVSAGTIETTWINFNGTDVSSNNDTYFTTSTVAQGGNAGNVNGTAFSKGMKINSSANIDFTTTGKVNIVIYMDAKKDTSIKVDGTVYSASAYSENGSTNVVVVTLELAAGAHTITRGNAEAAIYRIEVIPI